MAIPAKGIPAKDIPTNKPAPIVEPVAPVVESVVAEKPKRTRKTDKVPTSEE